MALVLIFDLVTHQIGNEGTASDSPVLWYYILVLLLFFIYRGNPVFIYDSDGEVIIITNKEPSLQKLIKSCNRHYEFPKRKVVGYSITKMPLRKKLTIRLESKEGTSKKVKASISYINKQELKDLERSLRSTLSKNKKSKAKLDA
jgi:hypothetical protein